MDLASAMYKENTERIKERRLAQFEKEARMRREQHATRMKQEQEEREAWARIPECVKLADTLNMTASLLENMQDYPVDHDMWFVKTALVNCTAALQFLLKAEIQRGGEQDED